VLEGFHIGVQCEVRIATAEDIGAAETNIVATRRFDVKYAIEDAVVKAVNVVVS
jgi:hypothetical protein